MVTHYDEKGKIFTQFVSKHPVQVIIQSAQNMIRGTIHVRPDMRVKDELNTTDAFIAVTDAVVYNTLNEEIYRSAFMVINTDQIVWVIPEEDLTA
jgi:hypothetical protein